MTRKFWLRLAVTAVVLAVILTQVDFSRVQLGSPRRIAVGVSISCLLLVINQGVTALRWSAILGDRSLSWTYLTRLNMVGIFFSTFLPTSVGGDAVRAWAIAREIPETGWGVSSVVLDRVMGLVAMVLYLIVGTWLDQEIFTRLAGQVEWTLPSWIVWALLLAVPVGVLVVRRTRWWTRLSRTLSHFRDFIASPGRIAMVTVLSLAVQGIYIGVWIVLAEAVRFDLPAVTFLVTVPVVSLGAMLPITLSGVGVREGLWILLLAGYGLEAANVTAFSLLYFLAFAVTGALGGGVYLWRGTANDASSVGDS